MKLIQSRRSFLQSAGTLTAVGLACPAILSRPVRAADTVDIGCLFSSSGQMANLEARLNYVVQMAVDEVNAAGGVNGATVKAVVTDPASDGALYAQLGKQMLQEQNVAALFGCWNSYGRKSVLPVVEQNEGLLFYPLHFEGEENSPNIVYVNSPPASSVIPAIDYLMSDDGGNATRFFMLGSDYVWPRTINKQLKGYWESKGITEDSWVEKYVPLGFSNFQTLVNEIRAFLDKGEGQAVVVLTVVGNSIPDFLREFSNQGIRATDAPILGLDMLEADLEGLDTAPLVGHLNCWAYLQSAKGEANQKFLASWADYVRANKVPFREDVAIDPMVSAYDAVHLWAKAAAKAGSFGVPEVRDAFAGLTFDCPSGYEIRMTGDNNYVWRGVFIGSVNANQGFDVLWQSPDTPEPVPFGI